MSGKNTFDWPGIECEQKEKGKFRLVGVQMSFPIQHFLSRNLQPTVVQLGDLAGCKGNYNNMDRLFQKL
jgi:hypothetical protein